MFRIAPPEGYEVRRLDQCYLTTERALVEALRFRAQMPEGAFPADINTLLEARPKIIARFHRGGPPRQEYTDAIKMASVIVRGLMFAQTPNVVDDWHYAGKDVKLGESGKPLCWRKNEDAQTYRVLLGDLGTRDVPAEQLPGIVR